MQGHFFVYRGHIASSARNWREKCQFIPGLNHVIQAGEFLVYRDPDWPQVAQCRCMRLALLDQLVDTFTSTNG